MWLDDMRLQHCPLGRHISQKKSSQGCIFGRLCLCDSACGWLTALRANVHVHECVCVCMFWCLRAPRISREMMNATRSIECERRREGANLFAAFEQLVCMKGVLLRLCCDEDKRIIGQSRKYRSFIFAKEQRARERVDLLPSDFESCSQFTGRWLIALLYTHTVEAITFCVILYDFSLSLRCYGEKSCNIICISIFSQHTIMQSAIIYNCMDLF